MKKRGKDKLFDNLPACAAEFIKLVIKKMRYRREVRQDVMAELVAHFEDELRSCATDEEKEQKAQQLIGKFGDVKLLAVLLRRAKKRCRPLWRTVVARTFQTIGILILGLIIYTAWFFSGKPVVTVDYIAELNRVVQPVADESLNAAPLYNKAVELYEEKSSDEMSELLGIKYNEATDEQKQLIEEWLNNNEEIFDSVIASTHKPYYWQSYKSETGDLMSVLMPNLAGFRRLAYALRWKAWLQAEQGQYEDAFDDMKSCYRFGQHIKGDKILIEQLVGIAFESLAVRTLRSILSEHKIDSATLATLQRDFEQMIASEDFVISMKTEKLFMYDEIQRCFTEDRFGGGHLYLPRIMAIGESWQEEPKYSIALIIGGAILSPRAWINAPKVLFTHPSKQQTREMADRLYDFWDKTAHKTPAQLRAEGIDAEKETMEIVKGNLLLEILTPALSRINEISHRTKADVEAALAIIAILRYRQDIGSYPENLDKLLDAGFLKQLPMDPWSDRPLVYKKTDDNFTLYGVGLNFKDDGGKVVPSEKDECGRRRWSDEGDHVFWPVRK